MNLYEESIQLKEQLKSTWPVFFAKYGRFLPIQLQAMQAVLEGKKNIVVISATASGKTEAVIAPLVERFLREDINGLIVVYIAPTRALVNDIYQRLERPLNDLSISVAVKTADRAQFNPLKPSNFVITTPEAFDSLLCRHQNVFTGLKAVILDDLHLIDGTYRGDQVRILLKRLRKIVNNNRLRFYALSATIANPQEVIPRYFGEFEIYKNDLKREINYTLFRSLTEAINTAKKENLKKILVFCNTRINAEKTANELKNLWKPYPVVIHHSSLKKQVREEAERFMKEAHCGVCVATTTMEVGIDIGSLDAVILADIPFSIYSLLQRVGRSNRRSQAIRALALYRNSEEELFLHKMFTSAKKGDLEIFSYQPDLSVIVQQIFSILYANSCGVAKDYFLSIFNDFCSPQQLNEITRHLRKIGYIEDRYDKWFATTKLMDLADKGKIHSNIPDKKSLKVVDIQTDKLIGEVTLPVDNVFVIAGISWKVIEISESRIYAKKVELKAEPVKFCRLGSSGSFFKFLPDSIKQKIKEQSYF